MLMTYLLKVLYFFFKTEYIFMKILDNKLSKLLCEFLKAVELLCDNLLVKVAFFTFKCIYIF